MITLLKTIFFSTNKMDLIYTLEYSMNSNFCRGTKKSDILVNELSGSILVVCGVASILVGLWLVLFFFHSSKELRHPHVQFEVK